MEVEFRNDDVLQIGHATVHQSYHIEGKDVFQLFLEVDKWFEKFNYSCTLAILAEGIEHYPEWVEHIKKNKHRYKIELHGLHHDHYNILSREKGKADLVEAIEKIEKTFGCKITTWYVPFGRRRWPVWGKEVCDELGLIFDPIAGKHEIRYWLKGYKKFGSSRLKMTNFHYWHPDQANKTIEALCLLNGENLKIG